MPRPGRRRPRSSLVDVLAAVKEPQPDWFLKRREEGWNGRFASDGPSYFDVPVAIGADRGSHLGPGFGNITGGSSVGGTFRGSGKAAGKRMRVRTNMTPSLSRGKGEATHGSSNNSSRDFYRMEEMYPDEAVPIPTATATARAAAAAAAAAARDGRSTGQGTVGKVSPPTPPRGLHQQQHLQPIVYPKPGEGSADSRLLPPLQGGASTAFHRKKPVVVVVDGGDGDHDGEHHASAVFAVASSHQQHHENHHHRTQQASDRGERGSQTQELGAHGTNSALDSNAVGIDTGRVDAGVLVAATRAATGACMYREQLLVRLHALVDDWPTSGPGHSGKQPKQHKRDQSATLLRKNQEQKSKPRKKMRPKAKTNSKSKAATLAKDGAVSTRMFSGNFGGKGVGGSAQSSRDDVGYGLSRGGGDSSSSCTGVVLPSTKSQVGKTAKKPKTRNKTDGRTQGSMAANAAERRPRAARDLTFLAGEIRKAGLSCVENIVAWSLVVSPGAGRPTPFRWNSQDYLAKMHTDLDFVSEALGKDAPSFGKGNSLLLTRDEATGQPRAGKVGRYYAATYVTLDAANRARDATTTAPADSSATADADAGTGTDDTAAGGPKCPFIDNRVVKENNLHFGNRGEERAGDAAGRGRKGSVDLESMGSGGRGVRVVASDDAPLDTTGEHVGGKPTARQRQQRVHQEQQEQQQQDKKKPKLGLKNPKNRQQPPPPPQQQQQQQQQGRTGERAHPETGGVLERGHGWSPSEEKPQSRQQQQQQQKDQQPQDHYQPPQGQAGRRAEPETGLALSREEGRSATPPSSSKETSPRNVLEDEDTLSDAYGESFEEFEEDEEPVIVPHTFVPQRDSLGEAQLLREKAENLLRDNEEKAILRPEEAVRLVHEEDDKQVPEAEQQRLRNEEHQRTPEAEEQRLLDEEEHRLRDGERQRELEAEQKREQEAKEKVQQVQDEENQRLLEEIEQRLLDEEQQRLPDGDERQRALEEEEEEEKGGLQETEDNRLRDGEERQRIVQAEEQQRLQDGEESEREREVDERQRAREAQEKDQRLRNEESQRLQDAEQQRLLDEKQQQLRDDEERQREVEAAQEREREAEEKAQQMQDDENQRLLEEIEQRPLDEEQERLRDGEERQRVRMEAEQQQLREEEDRRMRGEEMETMVREREEEENEQARIGTATGQRELHEDGEIPTSIGDYSVDCLLGDGAYGWVYKCRRQRRRTSRSMSGRKPNSRDTSGGDEAEFVAIKQFKGLTDMEDEHTKNYVLLTQEREADLALSLLHPNIVRCLGTLTANEGADKHGADLTSSDEGVVGGDNVAFLIFEHVPGTLLDLLQERPGGLTMPETTSLLVQILSAVGFLHKHGVVHRDVKPENILVDKTNPAAPVLKLCDLGTARKADECIAEPSPLAMVAGPADKTTGNTRTWTEYVGSRWYRAPEMLAGSTEYGTAVDVWACACLAAEMSSGRPLFPGEDEGELAASMAALLGPLPLDLASRLREMGYTPPPPRGSPTRSLEACLDGSTGGREARCRERNSRAFTGYDDGKSQQTVALIELLGGMLAFDPARRLSAQECLLRDVFFGGNDVVSVARGAVDPSAAGRSRGSSSGVAEDYGSDETTGAVFDQVDGGASGSGSVINRIGAGDGFDVAVGGESCDGTADTFSGLYDDESVVEMEREIVSGDKDGSNDNEGGYGDDGGYDDDEYEAADDGGEKNERRASSGDAAALGRERAGPVEVSKLGSRHQELEEPVSPPQETAFLGQTGYVRKRVIEIEEKEEYFNSAGREKNAQAGADAVTIAKEDPAAATCDKELAASAAAFEGVASDTRIIDSSSCSTPRKEAGGISPAGSSGDTEEPSASTVRCPVGVDTATSSCRAFDAAAVVAAAVSATVAADVTEDIATAAVAGMSCARNRKTSVDCLSRGRLGEESGNELDGCDNLTSNSKPPLKHTGSGAETTTKGDIGGGKTFGDKIYDSDSFDESELEDNGGAPTDIGGRTSFFPRLEPSTTAEGTIPAAGAPEIGIIAGGTGATAAPGAAGVLTSQDTATPTAGVEESGGTPSKRRPEGIDDDIATQKDGGTAVAVDEAAEKDEGNDGDGWRVAGAFRVLAASGPGGDLAVKAVKALLRRQGRRPPRSPTQGAEAAAGGDSQDLTEAIALFRQALVARGGEEGNSRRSMEHAFATAPSPPQEEPPTDDHASTAAAARFQKALEAFAADAGAADGEGLSSPRLVRLTTGLARCVDEKLRETAADCQAWAAKARQGKRPPGRGERGPLLECSEHLANNSLARLGGSADDDGAATGGVATVCAVFIVALCKAADRGRAAATADSVHASSSLQSLSRAVCALAPFVLDADRPKPERDGHLISVAASMGLEEGLARQALRPSSLSSVCLLSAAAQAVLFRAALAEAGERRVNLVTTREEALEQIELALESELPVTSEGGSKAAGLQNSSVVLAIILNPYYLSPWGKKKVMGKRVEEGEGLGPRKELFELAARQLSERWRLPPRASPSSQSPAVWATTQEGTAEVELVINPSSDVSERAFSARVKEGWLVKVGGQTRTLSSVKVQDKGGDGGDQGGRFSCRVTRLWMDGFRSEEALLQEACRPVLVYQQASESNWLDAKADRSDAGHRRRLQTLGALLALSVTNACRLQVELPDLFFRWLLHRRGREEGHLGGSGQRSALSAFQPSVEDMVALDPSLARPFEALKDAVQSKDALEGLLEIEALPANTSAEDYISYMVRQTFLEPVQWQISEVRDAFFRSLPSSLPGNFPNLLLPRAPVLAEIIRGKSPLFGDCSHSSGGGYNEPSPRSSGGQSEGAQGPGGGVVVGDGGRVNAVGKDNERRDFDFRETFLVYEDPDLVACAPLREAFWSVVQSELSPAERRLLLLFITGTDRLPEVGCETLSIEIPFELPGCGADNETASVTAEKALGQVPTAHTCDNVLELPNYWTFLMQAVGIGAQTQASALPADDRKRLEARLRETLAGRLRLALNNATGYTLDDLDDEDEDEDDDGGFDTARDHIPADEGSSNGLAPLATPTPAADGDEGDRDTTDSDGEDFSAIPSLDDDGSLALGASKAYGADAAIDDGRHSGSIAPDSNRVNPDDDDDAGAFRSNADGNAPEDADGSGKVAVEEETSPGKGQGNGGGLGGYFDDDDDIYFDVDGLEEVLT